MGLINQQILLCPGPVNVAPNVFSAMFKHVGHREDEFSTLLEGVSNKLLHLFEIEKKEEYHPVLITGSGTAANEAVLSSVVGDQNILIISNGEFGERLVNISKIHNKNTKHLTFQWGEMFNLQKIEKYLSVNNINIIGMVHHETSTGMLNPVQKIGELAKKYNANLFVDCVSSAGAELILPDKWNITFLTTASGKAISSLPGLGIIIGRKSAFEELKHARPKTAYLNLYNLYHYSTLFKQTPNTPAVHLFYALDQALSNILKQGIENWRSQIAKRASLLRQEMKKLGLQFLINESYMSNSLTTVYVPSFISSDELKKKLKGRNIVIYKGKGPFSKKVFQVGNIGVLKNSHLKLFSKSLADVLFSNKRQRENENRISPFYYQLMRRSERIVNL